MSIFTSNRGQCLFALAVAGVAACGSGGGTQSKPDARPAAFRDAEIYNSDTPIPENDAPDQLPECPASCDDQNPCTKDSCDPDTHLCRNDPATDETSCVATDLCSIEAACKSGVCVGTRTKDCTVPPDECHEEGYCVPTTGLCTYPNSLDHKVCDDGNLCTTGDQCMAGVCQAAPIQCGAGATCDPKTGQCPGFPTATWGVALDPSAETTRALDSSYSDIAVSPTGSLFFAAGFANTLDLGAGPMSTTSTTSSSETSFDYDAFVARLDPATGRALWSKSFGDRALQVASSIAANADDVVLMSGVFSGQLDLGSVKGVDASSLSLNNTGSFDKAFLVALDGLSGKVLWGLPVDLSSSYNAAHSKVTADLSDNNFVFCASPNKLVTDLSQTRAGGLGDVLIAKLSAQTGKVLWAGQYGGAGDESCDAVAADGKGKIYITGRLGKGSALDFGNGGVVLTGPAGPGLQAVYVAQVDSVDGTIGWREAFQSQGTATGKIKSNAIVSDGNFIWVGGNFTYSAVFDKTVLPNPSTTVSPDGGSSPSAKTAWVVAFDAASGTSLWGLSWGANAEVAALALNSTGGLVLGGSYQSGMVFGAVPLPDSPGSPAPFVARLTAQTGDAQEARGYAAASTSTSAFLAFATDKAGAAAQRDATYALGLLGNFSKGIDLGSPVGPLPPLGVAGDAGAFSETSTLFLVKFNP